MAQSFSVGIDIGGSHISAALMDEKKEWMEGSYTVLPINPDISKNEFAAILKSLMGVLLDLLVPGSVLKEIGMAVPGPFLYRHGIAALMPENGKLFNLFGLHLPSLLYPCLTPNNPNIATFNDAVCFGTGSLGMEGVKNHKNVLAITLGTGLGSVFFKNGVVETEGNGLPEQGFLYNQSFKQGIADDYFSTRGILTRFHQLQQQPAPHALAVSDLALKGNTGALATYESFGKDLAAFLCPFLANTNTDCIVIGGSIAKSAPLFVPYMEQYFQNRQMAINLVTVKSTSETIIQGAVRCLHAEIAYIKVQNTIKRKASQPIAPRRKESSEGYTIYPSMPIGNGRIQELADTLIPHLLNNQAMVIDGYGGVDWGDLVQKFNQAFSKHNIQPLWICADAALKEENTIKEMLSSSLGASESIFGKRFHGELSDFFDETKLNQLRQDDQRFSILYGTGSALANWQAPLIYAELPKNELQYRMRAGAINNLGCQKPADPKQMYKQFYFVDWPVLNRHKELLLPRINYLLDVQDPEAITWMTGAALQESLHQFTQQAFRARPWFEPGVWGGQWMKKNFSQLNQEEKNFAWSFELITPENGLTFESDGLLLELSFDFLMYRHAAEILGDAYGVFNTEFPIRFDFLDTFDGDNLSIQCHPSNNYIRHEFGENFTQDETYYILDCDENATVYLGFQDTIVPEKFEKSLRESFAENKKLDIEQYVKRMPCKKHDLFLIPNQTIHGAGSGNLVLEISSTPYIFTFKLYDWLRPDLDGKPRPINIDHGIKNLDFSRKGKVAEETLVSAPILIEIGKNWKRFSLPTHPGHFYSIERYEFDDIVEIEGNNQCHILMLVQGQKVSVRTQNSKTCTFHYAETFVVPASARNYRVKNTGRNRAMLILAYVKPAFCRQPASACTTTP